MSETQEDAFIFACDAEMGTLYIVSSDIVNDWGVLLYVGKTAQNFPRFLTSRGFVKAHHDLMLQKL